MTHTHLIRKTLGIKDQNITLENKVSEKKIKDTIHLVYHGKLIYTPRGCINYGVVNRSHADIVKNVNAAMSFLFIDAQTQDVIDVIENRQQAYLSSYFLRYSLQARRKVTTVTMYMYSPYIGLVKQHFPGAEIIFDCFHIVQLLNRALNQVRIIEMKKTRYLRPRDYRKLKRQWRLILKNDWDLNHENYYTHRLYDGLVSVYIMLEYLLSLSPALYKAYQIVNRLKWDLKNCQFEYFEEALNHAKEIVYPQRIRTALTTLEKYLDRI